MLRIKEVEMVKSVDDLLSSCSVEGIPMPDFEVLDAESSIIPASRRKVSLEERKPKKRTAFSEEGRSLT